MVVSYPWPHKDLNPNARIHWAKKSKLVKQTRLDAWLRTIETLGYPKARGVERAHLIVTYHPPTKAKRDLDNCIAASKAIFDGIADALKTDDSRFRLTCEIGEKKQGGEVSVFFDLA